MASGQGQGLPEPPRREGSRLFKILNPELFVRPRRWATILGSLAFLATVAFIANKNFEYSLEQAEMKEYEEKMARDFKKRQERVRKKLENDQHYQN